MTSLTSHHLMVERFSLGARLPASLKHTAFMAIGVGLLILAAKIKVPMWPVPVSMGTFAVLCLGAAYGMRLGLATILAYLVVGGLGFDVFSGSSAELNGLAYMMGGTGGYLAGFVLATLLMGFLAARGWDRSAFWMALAMLICNIVIYVPGLFWLGHLFGWDKPILEWGLWPFLPGDALKLALAALLMPLVWKVLGETRC
jgi:biotin transport system substrate-specific component